MTVFSSSPVNDRLIPFLSSSERFGLCLPSDPCLTRTAVLCFALILSFEVKYVCGKLKYYNPIKWSEGDASDMDKRYSWSTGS